MAHNFLECPECHRKYPAGFSFCIEDGTELPLATPTAQTPNHWLETLRNEPDRLIRGRLIVLNEFEFKNPESFLKLWQSVTETYLRVDLLRFGPPEILNVLSRHEEIYNSPSLYLCFLKRCLAQTLKPAFLETLPRPQFDSGLYVYLRLMLKWDLIPESEIHNYQNHNDYSIRELISNIRFATGSDTPAPLRVISPASVKLQVS